MPYTPEQWEGMAAQAYLNGMQERSVDLHSSSMAAAQSYGVRPVGPRQAALGVYHPAVMNGTMGASAWEWVSSPLTTFSNEYVTPAVEQVGKYSAQYEAARQAELERQQAKNLAMYAALAVGAGLAVTYAMKKFGRR